MIRAAIATSALIGLLLAAPRPAAHSTTALSPGARSDDVRLAVAPRQGVAPAESPQPTGTRPAAARASARTSSPPSASLRGVATWYRWRPGQAAAGPALRRALGPRWRGRTVWVNGIRVRLTDWCSCRSGNRIIDLDARTFARIAPLSSGVVPVEVRW